MCKQSTRTISVEVVPFFLEVETNKDLVKKIFSKIKKTPADITAYEDLFSLCRNIEQEDFSLAHSTNEELRKEISEAIKRRENTSNNKKSPMLLSMENTIQDRPRRKGNSRGGGGDRRFKSRRTCSCAMPVNGRGAAGNRESGRGTRKGSR